MSTTAKQPPAKAARPAPAPAKDAADPMAYVRKILAPFGDDAVRIGIHGLQGRTHALQQLVRWNYTRGQDFVKVAQEGRYKPGVTLALAQVWALSESGARELRSVAERISPPEFNDLLALRMANGTPFTWTHIRNLALIEDPKERKKFADRAVAKNWNSSQLELDIASRGGAGNARLAGRKQAVPDTFGALLKVIESRAIGFANYQRDVVAGHIDELIDDLSPDRITEETFQRLDAVLGQLSQLKDTAASMGEALDKARARLGERNVVASRPALPAPADPDVIDVEFERAPAPAAPPRKKLSPGKKPGRPGPAPRRR